MNNNEENKNLVTPENQGNITPVTPGPTITSDQDVKVMPVQSIPSNPSGSLNEQVKQVDTTLVVENNVQPQEVNQPVTQNTSNQEEIKSSVQSMESSEDPNNNKGPSTFAKIMTTLLFIFLFAFVYFLGDITNFINEKKLEKENAEIMNGKLICSNEKTTENLDVKISAIFTFENKQITGLTFTTTSTGDKTKDKEELEQLKEQCNLLKEEVTSYNGVSVVCSLNNGINSVKQIFDYSVLDVDSVRSAFVEAGGVYPQFQYKDDINSVESQMISSDYICEKVSS